MHKRKIALSSLLVLACTQTAWGVPMSKLTYRFTKPTTSYAAFQDDRHDCLKGTREQPAHWYDTNSRLVVYDMGMFKRCMLDRGYALDSKGFKTSFRYPDIKPQSGRLSE